MALPADQPDSAAIVANGMAQTRGEGARHDHEGPLEPTQAGSVLGRREFPRVPMCAPCPPVRRE